MKYNHSFDPLGRFYTQPTVSEALVDLINANPATIVDLGSGGGSLAIAAGKRWKHAEITTIDIDEKANLSRNSLSTLKSRGRHTHLVSDILRADLPTILKNKSFGVIVCNPPYVSTDWRQSFGEILEEAGLSVLIKQDRKMSLEILFLAQCLRLSDESGLIALVVPDGLITGKKHAEFRQVLAAAHQIETVMQLPEGSFEGTQARAFIMVIAKKKSINNKIRLMKLSKSGIFSHPIALKATANGERLDYDYHISKHRHLDPFSLEDLGAEIKRGSLNSAQIRDIKYSTFHTCDFSSEGASAINLIDKIDYRAKENDYLIAEKGDILLARVDRGLHKKVALVSKGRAVLSDCIYRIRVAPALQKEVFDYLTSPSAEDALRAISRGVGARMLPKHELLKMPLRIKTCKKMTKRSSSS